MTSRQRVLTAMRYEEPDPMPLFYRDGPEVRERLLKDLNLNNFDELLAYFEIDFRFPTGVTLKHSISSIQAARRIMSAYRSI